MFSVQSQHKRSNQDTRPRISSRRLQVYFMDWVTTSYPPNIVARKTTKFYLILQLELSVSTGR